MLIRNRIRHSRPKDTSTQRRGGHKNSDTSQRWTVGVKMALQLYHPNSCAYHLAAQPCYIIFNEEKNIVQGDRRDWRDLDVRMNEAMDAQYLVSHLV